MRLARLEGQRGTGVDPVLLIVRLIVEANGEVTGYHGQALSPTGWQTITGNADAGLNAFEQRLWSLVEDA